MATHRERILAYLTARPDGADDDQLAIALGISPRQTANRICRDLAAAGEMTRNREPCGKKLVNTAAPSSPVSGSLVEEAHGEALHRTTETSGSSESVQSTRVLDTERDALRFGYAGKANISEDEVSLAVKRVLQAAGWAVIVHWGQSHGIDVDAQRGSSA